jgi:ethanolamine utilization protein EutQ (cupin superfamily)
MQGSFECIQEDPSEDSIIWVCHVDHIEGDVFGAGVLGVSKDTRSVMAPTGSIIFSPKS